MNNKFVLVVFALMILFPMAMAQTVGSPETQFVYKQDEFVNFTFLCFDSNGALCSESTSCQINKITDSNGGLIQANTSLDFQTTHYNGTLPTSTLGVYDVVWSCHGGNSSNADFTYLVTYTGKQLSQSSSTFLIILFAILVLCFFLTIYGITKLPDDNSVDPEDRILKISYLKYLRIALWLVVWMIVVAVFFISSNLAFAYLEDTLFAQMFLTLYRITFGATPLIVILLTVWILVKIVDDKKIKNMWNRGIFPSRF